MTSQQILNRAAGLIEKKGLSFEGTKPEGPYCVGAALVYSSYEQQKGKRKFNDKEYVIARNVLTGLIGVNSSYESIVDWNDDFYNDKKGKKIYKRTKEEVVKKLRQAAQLAAEPDKVNTKS